MDRMINIDDTQFQAVRTRLSNTEPYVGKSDPLPGTALKLDDDVMWLDAIPFRACWGYETPDFVFGYNPEIDLDTCPYFEGIYITDRAPADPQETPMPIYPQQQQQVQRGGADKHTKQAKKRALRAVLKQLKPEGAKRVRELVRASKNADLLEGDDGDAA